MIDCCCTGIRYCDRCLNSERAQAIISGAVSLTTASEIIANQYGDQRSSSCSFTVIGKSQYSLCLECKLIFCIQSEAFKTCRDHEKLAPELDLNLEGLTGVADFLSEDEETMLVGFLDRPSDIFPGWKQSQSGRRKQDFGPKANFKKKKLKAPEHVGMPKELKSIIQKAKSLTSSLTGEEYNVVEISVLEYCSENCSSIDPHIDDTWIWGERVIGLNLLADTILTFVSTDGKSVDVFIPRRSFFLISGGSRYNWMHGIRKENIKSRRISFTMRELAKHIDKDIDSDLLQRVKEVSSTFI